jgi:cell growth-regulating nucleolar protein
MDTDDDEDPVVDAAEAAREYMRQELLKQSYNHTTTYGQFPPSPATQSGSFETPAPKPSHRRNISTTSVEDNTTRESTKKRKRGHPEDLDLAQARAYRANGDIDMSDVPVPLHSGLTGGLNKLLSRPAALPSPPHVDSPQSPLKRSKQAKMETKKTKEKEAQRKAEKLAEKEAKRIKDEKKERKLAAAKALKNGGWVRTRSRKDSSMQEQVSDASPEQPAKRQMKAIEYHPTGSEEKLKSTPNNAVVLHSKKAIARAEVFLAASAKDVKTDRGCSLNKALKRYYRDNASRKNTKDEKDLLKTLRFRENDRGELVLFIDGQD